MRLDSGIIPLLLLPQSSIFSSVRQSIPKLQSSYSSLLDSILGKCELVPSIGDSPAYAERGGGRIALVETTLSNLLIEDFENPGATFSDEDSLVVLSDAPDLPSLKSSLLHSPYDILGTSGANAVLKPRGVALCKDIYCYRGDGEANWKDEERSLSLSLSPCCCCCCIK